jgi:hypothetical protein
MAAEKPGEAIAMPAFGRVGRQDCVYGQIFGMMQEVTCSDVLAFRAYLDPIKDGEVSIGAE